MTSTQERPALGLRPRDEGTTRWQSESAGLRAAASGRVVS